MIILIITHFGFQGGTLVLIVSVPGHCLSFTLHRIPVSTLPVSEFIPRNKEKKRQEKNKKETYTVETNNVI